MSHIFISYSREDLETMREIRHYLSSVGFDVWTDEELVPGTPSWKNAIESSLETAKCLIALLSPNAKKSDWVERELDYALTYELTVIPVLIRGDKRTAVPFELISTQWLDIRTDFENGLVKLKELLNEQYGLSSPSLTSETDEHTPTKQEVQNLRLQFDQAVLEKKWNVVIGVGEQILASGYDDADIKSVLAKVYWQHAGGIQLEDGLLEINPYKQEMVIGFYDKAISLDPSQADYYFSRGMAYKRIADYEAALEDFQRASQLGHARASAQIRKLST